MANLAFTEYSGVVFAAFGAKSAEKREWDEYVAFLRRDMRRKARAVIFAGGSALENYQRRELEDFVKSLEKDRRIAVITASTFVRGFVKALALFEPAYRAYSPADLEAAFEYVQISPRSFQDAKKVLDDLRMRVDG